MFETVGHRGKKGGKVSAGAIGSLVVHVVIVAVIIFVSTPDAKPKDKKAIDYSQVTFKDLPTEAPPPPPAPEQPAAAPPPPPPPPPPAASPVTKPTETPKVTKKPKKLVEAKPDTVVAAPVDPNPPAPEPAAGGTAGGIEGGSEGGVVGGKIGGVEGGVVGGTGTAPTNAALPFGAGMERPKLKSGRNPEYTKAALEAKIEGTMIVRCIIEVDGRLTACKVIKPLAHMEEAVLSALREHEYTPVMFQGKPQRVNYTFNFKFVLP